MDLVARSASSNYLNSLGWFTCSDTLRRPRQVFVKYSWSFRQKLFSPKMMTNTFFWWQIKNILSSCLEFWGNGEISSDRIKTRAIWKNSSDRINNQQPRFEEHNHFLSAVNQPKSFETCEEWCKRSKYFYYQMFDARLFSLSIEPTGSRGISIVH